MSTALQELLTKRFFDQTTHFATANNSNGAISYAPIEGVPTTEELEEHLAGDLVLGSYTLHKDSTVTWVCWDVDCTDLDRARNITLDFHHKLGELPHGIEFSGNKGYHIWLFLDQPVDAKKAREIAIALRDLVGAPSSGNPHVEVFPKQDRLTAIEPLGNLVKLPLGLHPKTKAKSIFVDPCVSWVEAIDPQVVLEATACLDDLNKIIEDSDPSEQIIGLLQPFWIAGERHNLGLCLAGYLAKIGWQEETVTNLLQTLHGEEDKKLVELVEDTYQKIANGGRVIGFQGLSEKLPVNVLKKLAQFAGANIAAPILQMLDRIRLEKGTAFLKVRSSVEVITDYLTELGKFVRTPEEVVYWLDFESHHLYEFGSMEWDRLIYRWFGVNRADSYSKQVYEGLSKRMYDLADLVNVYRGSYWDGQTLHINFGGAEIVKLCGDPSKRVVSYNGENGALFITNDLGLVNDIGIEQVLQADALDPWAYMVDDLNFAPNELTTASNDQQRELIKAWVLAMFFRQILPTRPLLTLLGPPGSGKTTAARRILRFVEGFYEDVLSLNDDKPDSLRTSVAIHQLLALDNLEKVKASWLLDVLNRLATGSQIELRKLYRTNEKEKIRPDAFVICTAVEMPFSDESIFSRLLPMNLTSLALPRPEYWLQSQLKDNLASIWAGMLNYLDQCVLSLTAHKVIDSPTSTRLADFANFCQRLLDVTAVDHGLLMAGLDSLVDAQRAVLRESSIFVQVLEIWLSESDTAVTGAWYSANELNTVLGQLANKHHLNWRWKNGSGLGMHIGALEGQLKKMFSMEIKEGNSREGKKFKFMRLKITT